MKIENNNLNPIQPQRPEASHLTGKKNGAAESAAPGHEKDQAQLSERARLLAKTQAEAGSQPVVRQEKVDQLRQEIENGTYTVPIEELAKRLVSRLKNLG